jgi:hypothetical protein
MHMPFDGLEPISAVASAVESGHIRGGVIDMMPLLAFWQ